MLDFVLKICCKLQTQKSVWFGLCCLMTPGLSKDIRCHVHCMAMIFQNLQITRPDIRPNIKWAVSLLITYGHNLPQGFVWVCMS